MTTPKMIMRQDLGTLGGPSLDGWLADLFTPPTRLNVDSVSVATVESAKFTVVNGVCKPADFSTLAKVKELQNQINRVAAAKGFAKISADGDLGGGTVTAYNQAVGSTAYPSCTALGAQISSATALVKAIGDSLKVPATVAGPAPAKPPAITLPSGLQVTPPLGAGNAVGASIYDSFNRMGPTTKIAAAAIGVVGVVVVMKKLKKRR